MADGRMAKISQPHILYEDADFLAVVKPQGTPCQPDPTGDPDLLTAVSDYLAHPGSRADARVGSDARAVTGAFLIHRLDRGTGGVMLFAKNPKAAAVLSAAVQDKEAVVAVVKEYLALAAGVPEPPEGEMRDLLFTDKRVGKTFVVDRARTGAKDAALLYETLGTLPRNGTPVSLVRVRLLTGRTHQIRVQFASRGMPLCGDGKYGSRIKGPLGLWAFRLTLSRATLDALPHAKAVKKSEDGPLVLTSLPDSAAFDGEALALIDRVFSGTE